MEEQINIESIMAEIREEAKKWQGYDPDRDSSPAKPDHLGEADWTVSCVYPESAGNPVKRIYTRIVSKLIRCALFPVTERISQVHAEMKAQMMQMQQEMARQQEEIRSLKPALQDRGEKQGK